MIEATIQPSSHGKGRAFSATCLALVEGDALWGQSSDNSRPLFAAFAGSDTELRPFVANLRLGRKAVLSESRGNDFSSKRDAKIETMKSVDYSEAWQRSDAGSTCCLYLADMFRIDPGMVDPKGIAFVMMPSAAILKEDVPDAAEYAKKLGYPVTSWDGLTQQAYLFASYLDRRTRCPIVADGRFYLQLMLACLKDGLASWPVDSRLRYDHQKPFGCSNVLNAAGVERLGFVRPLAFHATHEMFEPLLAREVAGFFAMTRRT
jgi:hypothetical protein